MIHDLTRTPSLSRRYSLLLGSALLSSALLGLSPVLAAATEPPKEPNWYQIELLVFTQPRADIKAEYWQEQRQPKFASNAIQLQPSAGFADQQPSDDNLDNLPEQPAAAPQSLEQILAPPVIPNPRLVRELSAPLLQEYSDGAFTLLDPEQVPPLDPSIAPIDTTQLQRNGHRILFQGQWRQPVSEREQARSIVIRGGELLSDNYFELEGDIELSLSRYLHLRPNLYLTQALPPDWQPRHPKAIKEAIEALAHSLPLATEQTLQPDSADIASPLSASDVKVQPDLQPPVLEHPPSIQYLTTILDQPRRMRRNELHYIDHPLFGLLIRLTPFTPEPKVADIPVAQTLITTPATAPVAKAE